MPRDRLRAALDRELPGAFQESAGRICILPKSGGEVGTAVRVAAELGVRLAAPGAVQTVEEDVHAIALDLRRMSAIISIDDNSHLAHVEGGARIPAIELELRRRHLTLGIDGTLPEETLSAWLASGAPGARDHADDPVDQLVAGIEAVLPDGRQLDIRPAPRRAVGPDLVSALVGARGLLGVITGAHLVARRRTETAELAFRFPSRQAAEAARAWIRGRGARPASTAIVEADGEVALRLRFEGNQGLRDAVMDLARRTAAERGGVPIDPGAAPARTRPAPPPQSEVVRRLAARLDRAGVFG